MRRKNNKRTDKNLQMLSRIRAERVDYLIEIRPVG